MPAVIRWIITDATCIAVLTATSSVCLTKRNSDCNGEFNAAANARQVRNNQDYHKKAKDLGTRLGGNQRDGFDAELNTYGREGVVLGRVVGAFGEMSPHKEKQRSLPVSY